MNACSLRSGDHPSYSGEVRNLKSFRGSFGLGFWCGCCAVSGCLLSAGIFTGLSVDAAVNRCVPGAWHTANASNYSYALAVLRMSLHP